MSTGRKRSRSAMSVKPSFASIKLFEEEAHFRRLFKARHQEMNKMEIKTSTMRASFVDDPSYRFTVYTLQITSKVRRGDSGAWVLAKRYSEFFNFRKQLLKLILAWEAELDDSHRATREFGLISNSLRRPMSPNFPRKHMRCDTDAIVHERRHGLQEFVRKLLDAYVDISVYLYNSQPNDSTPYQCLRQIFLALEDFLDIPQEEKEVQYRQTAAVLALEDVEPVESEVDAPGPRERTCCICLDDTNSDDDDEEPVAFGLVRLPCAHMFHEDCVIDWFNASTTCPLCRENAVTEPPTSFDVSMYSELERRMSSLV
ncbi:TPA: hypothetical protein N0F65_007586 [Lagenidium giganteum]|uniref:RING-type domain-containing protein n=1 Tax=Lagenidium giganteum TaxID=4803 RepID=A0AAV2ZJC1_9STRA|nr:TPA: hypothetical protein N0F65_007586 [Lagenidium giganteum]